VTTGVVVVTHGAGRAAEPLLIQLLEEGIRSEDVVVVQNPTAPQDRTLAPPHPDIRVLRAEHNLGYAAAMNRGMRHQLARGASRVVLLTHDVRFGRGSLGQLLEAVDAQVFGIVGPVLRDADSGLPFSYGGARDRFGRTSHLKEPSREAVHGIGTCDWVDGAVLAVHRDVLEAVGLYEERFFGYCDDAELCLRATRAGWRVGVVLGAIAEQSSATAARPAAMTYLQQRNGLELARRQAGVAGVLVRIGASVRLTAIELGRILLTVVGVRSHDLQAIHARIWGLWWGTLDFARQRWGPPPVGLPGPGGYSNTSRGFQNGN
jgi:N-acetylglucosaminyl-diphospho-decaprenol L-rhamnosyltransferase